MALSLSLFLSLTLLFNGWTVEAASAFFDYLKLWGIGDKFAFEYVLWLCCPCLTNRDFVCALVLDHNLRERERASERLMCVCVCLSLCLCKCLYVDFCTYVGVTEQQNPGCRSVTVLVKLYDSSVLL